MSAAARPAAGAGAGSQSKGAGAAASSPPPAPAATSSGDLPEEQLSPAVAFMGTDDNPEIDMAKALEAFWADELERVKASPSDSEFKLHNDLPLARIKRIMKSDEDVRMISAEAPVLFAKACELFILELTIRGYCYTKEEKGKKRTLTREDLCTAAQQTDIFDFLVGVLTPGQKPSYMQQAEAAGVHAGSGGGAGAGAGAASSSAGGYGGMGAGSAADNDDDEMEGDGDEEEEEEGGMDADAAAPGSSSSAGRGQQQQAGRGGYPGASAAAGAAAPYNMVPYASGPKPMPGTKR